MRQDVHHDEAEFAISQVVDELLRKQGMLVDEPNSAELEQRVRTALAILPDDTDEELPAHLTSSRKRWKLRSTRRAAHLDLMNGVVRRPVALPE